MFRNAHPDDSKQCYGSSNKDNGLTKDMRTNRSVQTAWTQIRRYKTRHPIRTFAVCHSSSSVSDLSAFAILIDVNNIRNGLLKKGCLKECAREMHMEKTHKHTEKGEAETDRLRNRHRFVFHMYTDKVMKVSIGLQHMWYLVLCHCFIHGAKCMFSLQFVGLYDVVVNCTGLGSRELLNDTNVYPTRGHLIRVGKIKIFRL